MARFSLLSKFRDKLKEKPSETTQTDDGMAIVAQADAIASGENTYTAVNTKVMLVDHGKVTVAGGSVKATASAQSPEDGSTFASAETDVDFEGADLVVVLGMDRSGGGSGSSYDYSATMFRAVDLPFYDGPTKVIDFGVWQSKAYTPLRVDGNLAKADFDVEARGENTFAHVDAFTLAVEDQLSISTTVSTAAVV
jgi:hypothetical protein